MLVVVGIELEVGGLDCIEGDLLHSRVDHLPKAELTLPEGGVHVPLKLVVGDFVAFFVFAIPFAVLLNGIVGKVDDLLPNVIDVELVRGCPNVPFPEPIGPHRPVQSADHHVVPDVEFPPFVEKWFFDVLLHDVCLFAAIEVLFLFLQNRVQLVNLVNHSDALPSVGKLPRLHNPHILYSFLSDLLLSEPAEFLTKQLILRVCCAVLNVEGEWDDLEYILAQQLIVLLQVVEEGLLVPDEVVVL